MKIHMRWMIATFALALMATGLVVSAQDGAAKRTQQVYIQQSGDVLVSAGQEGGPPVRHKIMGPDGGMSIFIASEMGFGGKVVKGSPYSAQAITEAVQTLADGNRIVRKTTASVYRDSEGRTRQDQSVGNIGPYAVAGEPRQVIFINDPVSNVNYVLDARDKTARKMSFSRIESFQRKADSDKATAEKMATVDMAISNAAGGASVTVAGPRRPPMRDKVWVGEGNTFNIQLKEPKTESLGKQMFDGVEAEGTRETTTIAAGEIGNELPINITFERWYSPELQVVVMSKHTDPRVGENTYRLTGINRSEPSRTLFELPSDYTIKEAGDADMRLKMERDFVRSRKKSEEQ
ncbi:MAG TPA: hypothetical protein VJX74_22105 [Blastocatellia bacterium]|nr:hypothetical protein [Blastocatellia bacterium]